MAIVASLSFINTMADQDDLIEALDAEDNGDGALLRLLFDDEPLLFSFLTDDIKAVEGYLMPCTYEILRDYI